VFGLFNSFVDNFYSPPLSLAAPSRDRQEALFALSEGEYHALCEKKQTVSAAMQRHYNSTYERLAAFLGRALGFALSFFSLTSSAFLFY
jgi:hypothetical protein